MADPHRVSYSETKPTADLSLTDSAGNIIQFRLCDRLGDISHPDAGIVEAGNPRTTIQMSTGEASYANMELPFTPIVQSNWGGGRGQENFETDQTKYSDS